MPTGNRIRTNSTTDEIFAVAMARSELKWKNTAKLVVPSFPRRYVTDHSALEVFMKEHCDSCEPCEEECRNHQVRCEMIRAALNREGYVV